MNARLLADVLVAVAALLLALSIKRLTQASTAQAGLRLAVAALWLALISTLLLPDARWAGALVGLGLGAIAGWLLPERLRAAATPQMIAFLTGLGALSTTMVASASWWELAPLRQLGVFSPLGVVLALAGGLAAATFSGAMMAYSHMQLGAGPWRPLPGGEATRAGLTVGLVASALVMGLFPGPMVLTLSLMIGLAAGGVLLWSVLGRDMPVAIAALGAAAGWASALMGVVWGNLLLVAGGGLVGGAGVGLVRLMLRVSHRTAWQVLRGEIHLASQIPERNAGGQASVLTVGEVATRLAYARKVIVAPGYGLALSQGQHALRDLITALQERGVQVKVAIHPVAGRLPGHMNVLLSEAHIPYEITFELERINPEFRQADVALVVGASDIVNPEAIENPQSPLFGMPVLDVERSQSVVVIKRGNGGGHSGVANPLLVRARTGVLHGDAREVLLHLTRALGDMA